MIRVKLEHKKNITFKIKIAEEDINNILLKRAIMEGKKIKGNHRYNYEIPLRFFVPICNNIDKKDLIIDKRSILSYFEFSDFYDEMYYNEVSANPKYMKKWREEGCPDIYKITIDIDTYEIKKEIAFKKPSISLGKFEE